MSLCLQNKKEKIKKFLRFYNKDNLASIAANTCNSGKRDKDHGNLERLAWALLGDPFKRRERERERFLTYSIWQAEFMPIRLHF